MTEGQNLARLRLWTPAYLVFLVRVEKKDIDGLQLLDVAVSFELLSHLCADGRDGHVERVHLLNLGGLRSIRGIS